MFLGGFLMFGSLWFWILFVIFVCVMVACVENDSTSGGVLTIILFLCLFTFFGTGMEGIHWVIANPNLSLGFLAAYVAIGLFYMFLKWISFTRGVRRRYKVSRQNFLANYNADGEFIPDELKQAWQSRLTTEQRHMLNGFPPGEYKSQLVDWMLFWPFSALWTLINDPLRRLAETCVEMFHGVLAQIGKSASKGFEKDRLK